LLGHENKFGFYMVLGQRKNKQMASPVFE